MLAILTNSGLGLKKAIFFNLIPITLSYIGFVAGGFMHNFLRFWLNLGCFLDNVDESYDQYIFAISSGMYMYIFLGTLVSVFFCFIRFLKLAVFLVKDIFHNIYFIREFFNYWILNPRPSRRHPRTHQSQPQRRSARHSATILRVYGRCDLYVFYE